MSAGRRTNDRLEAIDEVSKWAVGLGILVVALFPLSIPILVLTAAALAPLALPLVALGLVAGVVAAPVVIARRVARRLRRRGGWPVPGPRSRATPSRGSLPSGL